MFLNVRINGQYIYIDLDHTYGRVHDLKTIQMYIMAYTVYCSFELHVVFFYLNRYVE